MEAGVFRQCSCLLPEPMIFIPLPSPATLQPLTFVHANRLNNHVTSVWAQALKR